MKCIRWPECDDIEVRDLKLIEDFYFKTEKGLILAAFIFPMSQKDKLKELKTRIDAAKKALGDIEGEIYKVSRDFRY